MKAAAEATECRRQAQGCAAPTPPWHASEEGRGGNAGGWGQSIWHGMSDWHIGQPKLCYLHRFVIPLEQNSSRIKWGTVTRNDYKLWTSTAVPRPSAQPLPKHPIKTAHHSISGLTGALTSTVNFPLSSSERRGSSWGWSLTIPSFRRVSCQKQKTEQVRPCGGATAAHRQLGREFLPPNNEDASLQNWLMLSVE